MTEIFTGSEPADRFRPKTYEEMKQAVRQLKAQGMSDQSIACLTRLSLEDVYRMLGKVP